MKYKIDDILSEGYVMGDVLKITGRPQNVNNDEIEIVSKDFELIRFNHSIQRTANELNEMKRTNPDLNEYLETERLIAVDPILRKRVIDEIEDGKSAQDALEIVMNDYIQDILKSSSEYLRERATDVRDIMNRLIANLDQSYNVSDDDKYILVVDTLYPSLLIQRRKSIIGVIAKTGGYTSHAAILCRSFDIPFVIADIECEVEDTVIIDTRVKIISVNPSKNEMNRFNNEYDRMGIIAKTAIYHDSSFLFLANTSNSFEVLKANEYNFDAIGLYRTEMIFMNSERPCTFLEQFTIYSEAVNIMKNKYITFRTFDVGDDKKIPYLITNKKGIDNYIKNPEIFEAQVSALLKANTYNNMRIMFPMIYSNSEFEYLRDWVIQIAKKNDYQIPMIGMMIETKSALENITDFVKSDFFSIGTNDLASDLYNIDRQHAAEVINNIDDLIERLKPVVEFANKMEKPLSVCGEVASIQEVAVKLYEIGIRALSVSPNLIKMLNASYTEFSKNN